MGCLSCRRCAFIAITKHNSVGFYFWGGTVIPSCGPRQWNNATFCCVTAQLASRSDGQRGERLFGRPLLCLQGERAGSRPATTTHFYFPAHPTRKKRGPYEHTESIGWCLTILWKTSNIVKRYFLERVSSYFYLPDGITHSRMQLFWLNQIKRILKIALVSRFIYVQGKKEKSLKSKTKILQASILAQG